MVLSTRRYRRCDPPWPVWCILSRTSPLIATTPVSPTSAASQPPPTPCHRLAKLHLDPQSANSNTAAVHAAPTISRSCSSRMASCQPAAVPFGPTLSVKTLRSGRRSVALYTYKVLLGSNIMFCTRLEVGQVAGPCRFSMLGRARLGVAL